MRRPLVTLAMLSVFVLTALPAGAVAASDIDPPVTDTPEHEAVAAAAYLEALWQAELSLREFLDWHLVERYRPIMDCIAARESGGSYTVANRRSTASGAFQWLDSSWRTASQRAGRPGWARAMYAPPEVQDYVTAWWIDNYGLGAWRASNAHRAC